MTSMQATDVRGAVRFALLAAMVCSGPQLARADQAETPPAQAHDLTRFDEVVVTAQRREQKLQDVGIAVTPLGEKALQDLNITNATDIVRAVPSLKMNAYSSVAGRLQHPRRLAERLRRPAGAAGCRLPGRQLLELDQPRELPRVRPRARRDAARPAGHAVRQERHRRRDPVHLAQAHRRIRGLHRPTYGSFNQVSRARCPARSRRSGSATTSRAALRSSRQGRRLHGVHRRRRPGPRRQRPLRVPRQPRLAAGRRHGRRRHPAVPAGGQGNARRGSIRHEPACPNAQNQGEFTPADFTCPFWADFIAGFRRRHDHRRSGRGTRARAPRLRHHPEPRRRSVEDRRDRAVRTWIARSRRAGAHRSKTSAARRSPRSRITRLRTSSTEGGDASPVDGVVFFAGQRPRAVLAGIPPVWPIGAHELVGGLFYMDVDGDYTGKFADPFYGYDPEVAARRTRPRTPSSSQDEWKLQRSQAADRRPALLARPARRRVLRLRAGSPGHEIGFDGTMVFNKDEIFARTSTRTRRGPDHADAERRGPTFDDFTARLETRLSRRTTTCCCLRSSKPRQQERRLLVLDRHAVCRF